MYSMLYEECDTADTETELHVIILYMLVTTNCLGIVLTVVSMYTNYNVICQFCG